MSKMFRIKQFFYSLDMWRMGFEFRRAWDFYEWYMTSELFEKNRKGPAPEVRPAP